MKTFRSVLKLFFCVFALALVFAPRAMAAEQFRVLTSTFPVWLFTRNVCADMENVRVDLLIPALAGCPHDYAPGPADLVKIEKADVLVINGLGLEGGLLKARETVAPRLPIVDAGKDVAPLLPGVDEHHPGEPNPHIFAAPGQASIMVSNIGEGLAAHDQPNAALYRANAEKYAEKLWKLGQRFKAVGAAAPRKGLALEHDALAYLAQNADLDVVALLPALRTPSAAQLRQLQSELADTRPVMIATDSQYANKIADMLAKDSGIPCAPLNPVANGPASAPLDYYEAEMEKNLAVLERYFK